MVRMGIGGENFLLKWRMRISDCVWVATEGMCATCLHMTGPFVSQKRILLAS